MARKKKKKMVRKVAVRKRRIVPLSGAFMLTAMFGFLITTTYTVSGRLDATWGFAFDTVFIVMFISSVLSITPQFPNELDKK